MGFFLGLFKTIFKLLLYISLFVSIVLLIPNLPPYTKFTSYQLEPTLPLTKALAPNNLLNNAEKLYEGKLLGPEMFEIYNGEVYTGVATGEILKISPSGQITVVTKIGQTCSGLHQEHICGRPLGLQIDKKNNQLYVADPYHGIWKVDLKSKKKMLLVSSNVAIDGRKPKLFNDIAVYENGDIYWTDSSSDFELKNGIYSSLMDPSGRLFYYNVAKNTNTVLLDKLAFPNGVIISLDQQFLLVAETNKLRILKYFINGPNKGKSEVFVAGLPGVPDTIRILPDGSGVLVALYTAFNDEEPFLARRLAPLPLLRKFLMRVALLIDNGFELLNSHFPHPIFENIFDYMGSFRSISSLLPQLTGLLQIDWNGNIVASYYNNDGTLSHISDAIVFNDKLYTACPHVQNFIGAIPAPPLLKKAFTVTKTNEEKVLRVENVKEKIEEKKDTSASQETKINDKKEKPVQASRQKSTVTVDKPQQETTKKQEKSQTKNNNEVKAEAQQSPKPNVQPKNPIKDNKVKDKPTPEIKSQPSKGKSEVKSRQSEIPENNDSPVKASKVSMDTQSKPAKVVLSDTKDKNPIKTDSDAKEKKPLKVAAAGNEEKKTKKIVPSNTEEKKPVHTNKNKDTKSIDKEIPVVEDIPSDTAKPNKDNLKVIKKTGPDVIPNPNL